MSERFFSSQAITSEQATLDGPEAHHLLNVMRAKVGAKITLFDDSGAEFDAIVEATRRADATVRILERHEIDRELPFDLTLGVALPKGDRQKWLVEKLTELGVTTLVPLITERGVAQPTENAAERLERAVIEAAKQCGRNRLLKTARPLAWSDWIALGWLGSNESEPPGIPRRLIAHPGAHPLAAFDFRSPRPARISIGPEGGLTDEEIEQAISAGWQQISLGPRILRVETAAIALAAACALAGS
jgi:16S rRNA (uracil1498-N3)-methyltransferase